MTEREIENYCRTLVNRVFHYQNGLTYPHGTTKAIRPYLFCRGKNGHKGYLCCMVSFTDGYIGDYSYTIDEGLVLTFKKMKVY